MSAVSKKQLSSRVVETAGRNWLTAQLLLRGLQVAIPEVDLGIDLIVFREVGASGIRTLPLQLKCATTEVFSADVKYAGRGIIYAFLWNVLSDPSVRFIEYDDCVKLLGRSVETSSWLDRGSYDITRIGKRLKQDLSPFHNNWDWLQQQLEI